MASIDNACGQIVTRTAPCPSPTTSPLPPPPVPTCPAMLCLRPPGKDDNPLTQKRKAAFDREPRKAQSVGGPPTQATARRDGKLQQWVRESSPPCPELVEAREYLLQGAPYRGLSPFAARDAVKALGGRWLPNPVKEERGDGMIAGWWTATSAPGGMGAAGGSAGGAAGGGRGGAGGRTTRGMVVSVDRRAGLPR